MTDPYPYKNPIFFILIYSIDFIRKIEFLTRMKIVGLIIFLGDKGKMIEWKCYLI